MNILKIQKTEPCVKCGEQMKSWTVACPHCGHHNGNNL
jgi:DNA-directed RNA polymerase subunit RPC12/RpoP